MSTTTRTALDRLPIIEDATLWYGRGMAARQDWIHPLTDAEVAELDAAVDQSMRRQVDLVRMTEADFPLPTLGRRLAGIRREILHGRGFALLRGWPSRERSLEQAAHVFRGVGAHLGEALSQNGKGHYLGHVANLGMNYADPTTRGYQTSAELRYHCDAGDIVGLLCVRPARSGGLSKICSSTAIWNEMVRRRPDLARELLKPVAHSRWGEVGHGQKDHYVIPPFHLHHGRLVVVFILGAIFKAESLPGIPPLDDRMREALLLVNEIADEPGIRLDMDFRPGDMQFLCNHSILHSRTAYEDWPEVENRRHLLRLWLACPDGPDLPDYLSQEFQGRTASGRPNGINVPGVLPVAPLQPA